jgi:uncharacterized protein (DUF4213/DUF364 family)
MSDKRGYSLHRTERDEHVGRFPTLEPLQDVCDLTVLERTPGGSDLPDVACEYVLPEQDCVCITGTAVSNKSLPRLLELSRSAYTVLVGPSFPLSGVWIDYGVDMLAGTVVTDTGGARHAAQEGAHRRLFSDGVVKVEFTADMIHRARAAVGRDRRLAATPAQSLRRHASASQA